MEQMIGEYGEALLYGSVGIFIVILICNICVRKWAEIIPDYKNIVSRDSEEFITKNKDKFPTIDGEEVIFADYRNEKFNYKEFITARDFDGKDLTDRIRVYGSVNVFQKGLYRLRCVVVSDSSLVCTKYVNVIVE